MTVRGPSAKRSYPELSYSCSGRSPLSGPEPRQWPPSLWHRNAGDIAAGAVANGQHVITAVTMTSNLPAFRAHLDMRL